MNYTSLAKDKLFSLKENKDYKHIKHKFYDEYYFIHDDIHYYEYAFDHFDTHLFIKMLKDCIKVKFPLLIVGIGNYQYDCDAFGPKVINHIMIEKDVYLFVPGVKGNTNLNTFDLVESIVCKYHIECIILLDSLAASDYQDLFKVVSMNDYGLTPGSGVNNAQKEISKKTLNKDVYMIGIPCVVSFNTIIYDAFIKIKSYFASNQNTLLSIEIKNQVLDSQLSAKLLGMIGELSNEELYELCKEIFAFNNIMTNKDCYEKVNELSKLISESLNIFIHLHHMM